MTATIQSIDFDAAEHLKTFIQTKFNKLRQFSGDIHDAQVYLKLEKNKNKDVGNKVVEFKILVPNSTLVASYQAKSFEAAVNVCVEQLTRQLIRHKEKIRSA